MARGSNMAPHRAILLPLSANIFPAVSTSSQYLGRLKLIGLYICGNAYILNKTLFKITLIIKLFCIHTPPHPINQE